MLALTEEEFGELIICLSVQNPIDETILLENISSSKIYPNPVFDNSNISFDLNKSELVNISVYNLNGGLVKNLYNNVMMNKGHIDIPLNSSKLSMELIWLLLNQVIKKMLSNSLSIKN